MQRFFKIPHTLLEITPPYDTQQSAYSTEQLYQTISSLNNSASLFESLLGVRRAHSLEIVASGQDGIRFLIRTSKKNAEIIKQNIYSFLPGAQIKEVSDYFPNSFDKFTAKPYQMHEVKLRNNFAYPLQTQTALKDYDPIAYITGHMTKLKENELIALQVLLTPITYATHSKEYEQIRTMQQYLFNGRDISPFLKRKTFLSKESWILIGVSTAAVAILYVTAVVDFTRMASLLVFGLFGFVWWYLGSSPKTFAKVKRTNSEQTEVNKQITEKLGSNLFETTIRIYAQDQGTAAHRVSGLLGALTSSTRTPYQSLKVSRENVLQEKLSFIKKYSYLLLQNRSHPLQDTAILSASEIASIYHFPFTPTTKTEDIIKTKSPVLPVPLSMKKHGTDLDVIIGKNTYGGVERQVGLSKKARKQHTYIVGQSGMGKSTIIEGMALQDIQNEKGVAVLDPHGDMVEHLLTLIPEERLKDVIYINPADKTYPVGLNILAPQVAFSDPDEKIDRIATEVLQIFMRITPEKFWGQKMEHILRNSILTALQIPQGTAETPYVSLYTIQKLLTDTTYRTSVTKHITDPVIKQFWLKEFKLYGTRQQADIFSPLTNKLGEFITNKMSRNILLQKNSTINISEILDEGKILLVNLAKGNLGDERSNFFGTIVTSLIQLAIYQRAQIHESKRRDFFVYIDEFQNFVSTHFTSLFSEGRKYHVFFIPSHQNIAQIDDSKVAKIIQGNSGTMIALKGSPDDEKTLLPFFSPEVEKGQIVNLSPHHFIMKVTNAYSEDAFTGVTIPVVTEGSESIKEKIIRSSRSNFATPRELVEEQLEKLFMEITIAPKKTKKKPFKKAANVAKTEDLQQRIRLA